MINQTLKVGTHRGNKRVWIEGKNLIADKVVDQLNAIYYKAIAIVQATHTKKDIIWYEMGNHEVQLTNDLTEVISKLKDFNITKQSLKEVIFAMNYTPDCHVMVETVKPIDEYTGVRE